MENTKRLRVSGVKYRKSQNKIKQRYKKLESLVYINFNLTNKDLAEKIGVSENEFYRGKYNLLANSLRDKYKQQSLF
ncbi:hypothetical protein H3N56_03025 [Cetobacterium sp. 2A]|uniref:hypothetical protein n=1 Tax=Cetobacterium sp. 2A TaxID=2754723 RepID=UPI00163CBFAF|nr:hypothetical protein [Cetobacterium sp. 2A]MBC2855467.1 hypothetical protein [Cetobacterium sp. 2A]